LSEQKRSDIPGFFAYFPLIFHGCLLNLADEFLKARKWADNEMDKLCDVIWRIGKPCELLLALEADTLLLESDNYKHVESRTVSFGDLFRAYNSISNSLMGTLMKGKKNGRVRGIDARSNLPYVTIFRWTTREECCFRVFLTM
jgi:hypothetical protein